MCLDASSIGVFFVCFIFLNLVMVLMVMLKMTMLCRNLLMLFLLISERALWTIMDKFCRILTRRVIFHMDWFFCVILFLEIFNFFFNKKIVI